MTDGIITVGDLLEKQNKILKLGYSHKQIKINANLVCDGVTLILSGTLHEEGEIVYIKNKYGRKKDLDKNGALSNVEICIEVN